MECLEKAVVSAIEEIEAAKRAAHIEPVCATDREIFHALRGTIAEMLDSGRLRKQECVNSTRLEVVS